jgi:hypothetical protein
VGRVSGSQVRDQVRGRLGGSLRETLEWLDLVGGEVATVDGVSKRVVGFLELAVRVSEIPTEIGRNRTP